MWVGEAGRLAGRRVCAFGRCQRRRHAAAVALVHTAPLSFPPHAPGLVLPGCFLQVSPSILAVDETVSTLNYAEQANGIKNKTQESSIKMSGSAGGFARPTAASGGGGAAGGGQTMADWNEVRFV